MVLLILSAVVSVVVIIGGIVLTVRRQPKKEDGVVVVMREPLVNLMMPVMLIALCGTLVYLALSPYGTDMPLDVVAGTVIMCALVGTYGILFTLLKQAVAYNDKLVVANLLGKCNTIRWDEITSVKTRPMTKKVTFYVGQEPYSVNGAINPYKKFIALASKNVPSIVAGDSLVSIDHQLNSAGNTLKNKRR